MTIQSCSSNTVDVFSDEHVHQQLLNFDIRHINHRLIRGVHWFEFSNEDRSNDYTMTLSHIIESPQLHPLIEAALGACDFIPNDLTLKEKVAFLQMIEI